jgi:hypothetical protein
MRDIEKQATFVDECKKLVSAGVEAASNSTNAVMVATYWNLGKRIVEEEQGGEKRAAYGKQLIDILSNELTREFGKGFSARNIRNFRKFYLYFPDQQIWQTCLPNLTWSHFCSKIEFIETKVKAME